MRTTYFGLALFVALVCLAWWKRRHDAVARMNRGLTNYVVKGESQAEPPKSPPQDEQ